MEDDGNVSTEVGSGDSSGNMIADSTSAQEDQNATTVSRASASNDDDDDDENEATVTATPATDAEDNATSGPSISTVGGEQEETGGPEDGIVTASSSAEEQTPVPDLLREWNNNNCNDDDNNNNNNSIIAELNTPIASRTSNASSTGNTPVAPVEAVVLGERVTDVDSSSAVSPSVSGPAAPTAPQLTVTTTAATAAAASATARQSLPQYSYPVATFVSNFVRDHIYASASAIPAEISGSGNNVMTAAGGVPPPSVTTINAASSSITSTTRSEPATPTVVATTAMDPASMMRMTGSSTPAALSLSIGSAASIPTSAHHHQQQQQQQQHHNQHPHSERLTAGANRNETLSSDLDHHSLPDGQTYVLVDGDLVAIPADHHHHHHDDEDHQDDYDDDVSELADRHAEHYLNRQDRTNCKGSRMQRGVRKFKKWKRGLKNRLGMKKHRQHELEHDDGSQILQQEHQRKADGTTASATNSIDNDSTLLHGGPQPGSLDADDETSAQFSIGYVSHQGNAGLGPMTDDDSSTIATNAAQSVSDASNVSSPSRNRGKKQTMRKQQSRKKKNLLNWPRSDRSIQSTSSSSLIQSSTPSGGGSSRTTISNTSVGAQAGGVPVLSNNGRPNVISLQAHTSAYDGGGLQMDDASSVASSAAASLAPSLAPPPSMVSRVAMPTLTESSVEISTPAASLTLDAAPATTAAAASSSSSASPFASMAGGSSGGSSGNPPLVPDPHSFNRSSSIAAEASFVGNADSLALIEAGVLPADAGVMMPAELTYIEDRLDDYDKYDKKDDALLYYDPYLKDFVKPTNDFKVDKQDAPCVDSMLRMADRYAQDLEENEVESEPPLISSLKSARGKSSGDSVPLSMASTKDPLVHNDILKLVMVGEPDSRAALSRTLRQSTKKPRKRTTLTVDVHSWTPENNDNIKFTIWDVQSANKSLPDDSSPNFGAHPGTQSLFFTDRALYILVWDMGADNYKTYRNFDRLPGKGDVHDYDDDDDYEEEGERENEYTREEANKQADRALQTDIEDRVLTWVDCVARRGSHSSVLPIALLPSNMSPEEAKRRCDMMQSLLMIHTERDFPAGLAPPKVLSGAETVMCVSLDTGMGIDLLQEMILDIATDASHSVFDHILTPVPPGTAVVLETVRRLKASHKLVLVDHLLAELPYGAEMAADAVMACLSFLSSIGELLYYNEEMLSHYVILSRKWQVSALSCILRNDLKRELAETRRFMNMQCLYSDQRFPESHVTQTFSGNASNCPIVSSQDTQMLWQSMSFMREAADRSSQLTENSTTTWTMYGFLERLLVFTGVFLPLDIDKFATTDNVYFVPSLLSQSSLKDVWTYKSSEAYLTTLCHSFLFRDGTPVGLIEQVAVALLRDLYEFSHVVAVKPVPTNNHSPPARSQTFPFAQGSFNDFMGTHDQEPVGQIKIHQIVCWKNSVLIKIGRVFGEGTDGGLRESFVEIFVAITDRNHPHSVATDAMRSNMQRLVVSAKGQVGGHGKKIWRGGYDVVLDSIKSSVSLTPSVREVVCPECLAHNHPSSASTWSWDSVRAATDPVIRCMKGHKVDRNMICGTIPSTPKIEDGSKPSGGNAKPVKELLPSVVVVGLFDCESKTIRNVGSGFIVDKKLGLVVTAGHILFNMEEGRNFGAVYKGLQHGSAVIGIIPEGSTDNKAVFRYFAEIVAEDIHNMDACVLKIVTRLDTDIDDDDKIKESSDTKVEDFLAESLPSLKMTKRYELEEAVRILGFNQSGEGILEKGKHVNLHADFARGYIVKIFSSVEEEDDDDSTSSGDSSTGDVGFTPRSEIVCLVPTISGHSGGPCLNDEGRVVGILSRADRVDRQRCYLVPSSELRTLVNKARKPGGLKTYL